MLQAKVIARVPSYYSIKGLGVVSDLLQERCKRETGDEWPKISHIQNIKINSKSVQKDCQLPLDSD